MNYKTIFKILLESFKQTFSGIIWKFIGGSAGSLIAVLLFAKNAFGESAHNSIFVAAILLSILYGFRFFIILCRNSFHYLHEVYRESKYGQAIVTLKEMFADVHLLRKKELFEDKEFMEVMKMICNELKSLFETNNSCKCSVSIKVPVAGKITKDTLISELAVSNLCRDSEATGIRDTQKYNSTNHTITGNTPYNVIVENVFKRHTQKLFYSNNAVSVKDGYQSTSIGTYGNNDLAYQSEIVVPILPIKIEDKDYDLLGFLCVDCVTKDKFHFKYDVPLVQGVSDGIYDLLSKRQTIKKQVPKSIPNG